MIYLQCRKRRKQLDSIHKMRVQEEYFDALFEQNQELTKAETNKGDLIFCLKQVKKY